MTADQRARDGQPRRGGRVGGFAALIALMLGLAGLVTSATVIVIQLLPRHFTAAQQRQIESWEISGRWRSMTAGQIFPASVPYQLPANTVQDTVPLSLDALRVAIAPQARCAVGALTAAAAAVLHRGGCEAVLRATYVDVTRSYVTTIGVAILPTAAAAITASSGLTPPRLAVADHIGATRELAAGVQVVRFRGPEAELYDYSRQMSGSFADGPYVVMYAVGYSDSRPRVPVSQDAYSHADMTSLAMGVARSVANRLGATPAPPHCPGSPGC